MAHCIVQYCPYYFNRDMINYDIILYLFIYYIMTLFMIFSKIDDKKFTITCTNHIIFNDNGKKTENKDPPR